MGMLLANIPAAFFFFNVHIFKKWVGLSSVVAFSIFSLNLSSLNLSAHASTERSFSLRRSIFERCFGVREGKPFVVRCVLFLRGLGLVRSRWVRSAKLGDPRYLMLCLEGRRLTGAQRGAVPAAK